MADTDRDSLVEGLQEENARLRRLLAAKGLPSTLRHQVRNTLGLMRAILRRSAETSTSVDDLAAHVEGRFDALLRAQSVLVAGSDNGVDLHSLLANELVAHVIHEGDKVTFEGPGVRIPAKSAEILGLAFHELVTNALKYGAIAVPGGHVSVTWSVVPGDKPVLDLTWSETGPVALSPKPLFRGFGIDALEGMLHYQLDARSLVTMRPEGLLCTITLPLQP